MVIAGCDVGSLSAEAVIMKDGSIVASEIIRVRPRPEQSASDVMDAALSKAGMTYKDIEGCFSTGYGREKIPFASGNISEISCHGKGAQWLIPSVRTVIDVGGQDCKVIKVDENGKLVNFVMNDKCAAGTGRFLEFMAKVLGIGIEDLGPQGLSSEQPVSITSFCSVYAETEVLHSIYEGKAVADIAAGINHAMSERVKALVKRVGVEEDICITGGVAKNTGVVKNLEAALQVSAQKLTVDPQLIGALGAALFAREALANQNR
ncbi:MAG TPA: 2-hydroxyglutaryl-CoA dehydratase [Dehalococcoidia bacterium]|nr:2-hydroxyglutaryl-CoA dehydratase [Dehalococcoidia bacterium]